MNMWALQTSCKERFAPVEEAIKKLLQDETKTRIIVALDGRCASGKSTLGMYLQTIFEANLFHMDDFFLQSHQRTKERLSEIGGNVDYERFLEQIVTPLLAGEEIRYQVFDCKKMQLADENVVPVKRLNIIEGSYCRNPYFGDIYDLKVFLHIEEAEQLENIRKRNGAEKLEVFQTRWIPKEEAYFEKFAIKETSDMVIEWVLT